MKDKHDDIKDRLNRGVSHVDPESGCWIWRNPTNRDRGQIRVDGRTQLACRVTWKAYRGPIPRGKHVLHSCDNPRCVNPAHLWVGSHRDNMADKKAKGRAHRLPGQKHPMAKLTNKQAREIYALARMGGITQREIGEKYGVTNCTVSNIVRGTQWATVSGFPRK